MTIIDHAGRYVFERDRPHYTPTPDEISRVAASIRAGWSDAEMARRLGCHANPPAGVTRAKYLGPEREC